MKNLESLDQNFIKTLLDNVPQQIEELSVPKNKISKNWISKQRRDIYVRQSKLEGYRARAVYKLQEIDQKLLMIKN